MKDYFKWHAIKSDIENSGKEILFRDREIWWCSLGENVGFEQDGKNEKYERPVLVFRKFNKGMFWGLPLTSKEKNDSFHYKLTLHIKNENDEIEEKISMVILSQLRLLSGKRLIRRVARINENNFKEIENKVISLIKTNENGPLSGSSSA
ncbi:MAG: type II toxin-antitoxin system PemK/MazF family toxin [Candidatus Nomurabacteria bacterium]|nr:type II toxin-antitoxin system PemK/MazF family toxin [Candidatus Nomurabacteria bacterium]